MNQPRIRGAGDSALLLDLEAAIAPDVNARAIAIARALRDARLAGVRDVVPAYRSVAVYFDPLVADPARIEASLRDAARGGAPVAAGRAIEVPAVYGGSYGLDLAGLAAAAGLSPAQVVALHSRRPYRVFMLGFLPGFPYLGPVDERIAAPRRPTPRLRVPAGSIGIAGRQTGIYPRESPGGWQIVGRTPLALFDPSREPPALCAPGDTVTFVPESSRLFKRGAPAAPSPGPRRSDQPSGSVAGAPRYVTVVRPGLLTTIQDEGRWGHQAIGVPVAGPLDAVSHRLANALVGNPRHAATLEVTLIGPELRLEHDAHIAVTGADLGCCLDGAPLPLNRPVRAPSGSVVTFSARRAGARSYVAFDGGLDVPLVLGSRATHVLSGLGGIAGRAAAAGDRLPLGAPAQPRRTDSPRLPAGAAASHATRTAGAGGARLRVLPGPQDDDFPEEALQRLQGTRFVVTPRSDRMGYRLSGQPLPPARGESISTPTFTGAIQVPPSGEPVLLMADRQTTGGYPQLATVIAADHHLAGQLAPGDWVEFEVCSRSDALAALIRLEGELLGVE